LVQRPIDNFIRGRILDELHQGFDCIRILDTLRHRHGGFSVIAGRARLFPMIVVCDATSVNAQLRLHRGYTSDADDENSWRGADVRSRDTLWRLRAAQRAVDLTLRGYVQLFLLGV